jgi:hypothetical protein
VCSGCAKPLNYQLSEPSPSKGSTAILMCCFTRSGLRKNKYSAASSSSVEIQCRNRRWYFTSRDPVKLPVSGLAAADSRDLPGQDICWLRSCRRIRHPSRESIVQPHSGASLQQKMSERGEMGRFQKCLPAEKSPEVGRGVTRAAVACTYTSAATAYGPNTRAASPARRQPLVWGGGKGAGAGAGRARPPPPRTKWPCDV